MSTRQRHICRVAVEVLIKGSRIAGRAASFGHCEDPHHPNLVCLAKCQHVAWAYALMRFGYVGAVEPHSTAIAGFLGEATGTKETCMPEPFIEACLDVVAQRLPTFAVPMS